LDKEAMVAATPGEDGYADSVHDGEIGGAAVVEGVGRSGGDEGLLLVGRVIHIASPFPSTHAPLRTAAAAAAEPTATTTHGVSWAKPEAFSRLLYTPIMFENHLTGGYLEGLQGWLDAVAVEGVEGCIPPCPSAP
jgi:hypothetical protein